MRLLLLVEWYRARSAVRDQELETALVRNCANLAVAEVHVFGTARDLDSLPARRRATLHAVPGRMNYAAMFGAAGLVSRAGDVCVVANADVWFDGTLGHAAVLPAGEAYCLSRWEPSTPPFWALTDRPDSQDAWIFRPPLLPRAEFLMGLPGGENRLAWLLMHEHGLRLRNPAWSIRAHHVHRSGVRTWCEADRVPGPYELVPPCALCG